jgi:hypothetical protein
MHGLVEADVLENLQPAHKDVDSENPDLEFFCI